MFLPSSIPGIDVAVSHKNILHIYVTSTDNGPSTDNYIYQKAQFKHLSSKMKPTVSHLTKLNV